MISKWGKKWLHVFLGNHLDLKEYSIQEIMVALEKNYNNPLHYEPHW